jgi:hypothetical protein
MECNIDARGKRVRLAWGVVMLVVSVVLAALTLMDVIPPAPGWIAGAVAFLSGAMGIYGGRKGWCMMRAMGFKTPV